MDQSRLNFLNLFPDFKKNYSINYNLLDEISFDLIPEDDDKKKNNNTYFEKKKLKKKN